MIFLAHYERRNRNGKKITEKQGIINAGNPKEAIKKVVRMIGDPVEYSSDNLKSLKEETVLRHKDSEGMLHTIQVSYLDCMMTLKNKKEEE